MSGPSLLKRAAAWVRGALARLLAPLLALQQLVARRRRLVQLAEQFPGDRAYPLIGNALDFMPGDSLAFTKYFQDAFNRHGVVFRGYLGTILFIVTGRKEDQEVVFSGNEYLSKSFVYKFLEPWLGDGLLLSTGEKWRRRRKALTPAFHFNILDQFVPVFNSCGSEFVAQLRPLASPCKGGARPRPFDVWPRVKLLTLDVICETIMGVKMQAQSNSNLEYVNAVKDISAIIYELVLKPWLNLPFIFPFSATGRRHKKCLEILHGTTDRVIRERRAELEKMMERENIVLDADELGRRKRVAFLDLLLLDGSLSDRDIREEVDTFMFEGHDTTASAIAFAIFLLSRHPHAQERAHRELVEAFDPSQPLQPSIQQLAELKYLEMVIKETMRLYPPVGAVAREIAGSDFHLKSKPLTVPSGSTLFLSIYMQHRNPDDFPEPDKFDPERFSADESARRHPYAYVPFSAGSRNCIGQRFAMLEMKSLLAKLIWNYKILPDPDFEPVLLWELVFKTQNGISICLEERNGANNTITN